MLGSKPGVAYSGQCSNFSNPKTNLLVDLLKFLSASRQISRPRGRLVFRVMVFLWSTTPFIVLAQTQQSTRKISIVYSGRSMGALGHTRSQEEHELLTRQAAQEGQAFKLVSHAAWRAPGVVIFLPSHEPSGQELRQVISLRHTAERLENVRALGSSAVLMVQDPWRTGPDLIDMLMRNPRHSADFPDLVPTTVVMSRLRLENGDRAMILEQSGAVWPTDSAAWLVGEMNRIDIGESRMFELPGNLGTIGSRSTLLREAAKIPADLMIKADLGHQNGEYGLSRSERSRIDWFALSEMGYKYIVPFEFELSLTSENLKKLRTEFPGITLLAANVNYADTTILRPSVVVDTLGLKIGLIGLVNSLVSNRLPRNALQNLKFESPLATAKREVAKLRSLNADVVVILSNMDPADNAVIAQEVRGIDAIVADLPMRTAPEPVTVRVELPSRPFARPGTPALVAKSAANGLGIGRLDLEIIQRKDVNLRYLGALTHTFIPITDRLVPDTLLMKKLAAKAAVVRDPRGELLFPAFPDLVARHPKLGEYDDVARNGRVSKNMWESLMARRLRIQGNAEVSVIRALDQFPPLIGKLHENEVRSWLWTEEEIVVVDMPGGDLRALLASDSRGELVASGIDLRGGMILGHSISNDYYYRVATTDILFEGARSVFFQRARRVRRLFETIEPAGSLEHSDQGKRITLRDFMLRELRRIQESTKGNEQIDRIAELLAPDPQHVNLFSFSFERPTIWSSFNNVIGNKGYESVPESRVVSPNALVAGISGRFLLSKERRLSATDLGFGFAYALQKLNEGANKEFQESADDLKIDLTFRPSSTFTKSTQPFVRSLFDSEFSATRNLSTNTVNPRQLSLRVVGGFRFKPGPNWPAADFGVLVENDFGLPNPQLGIQSRSEYLRQLGASKRGSMTYRLRNDLTYFFPAPQDTKANLSLRYSMVHELLVPLVDELSLSIASDFFFFRGKVKEMRNLGVGSQLRVGITYDRLWKPRYQPFL